MNLNLTMRQRLFGMFAFSAVLLTIVGSAGYFAVTHLKETNAISGMYADAIAYQMEADMMHDALRADVLASLRAGSAMQHDAKEVLE